MTKVSAIVVLYNNKDHLTVRNIKLISEQVNKIYLIDNSPDSYEDLFKKIANCFYLPQYKNLGIAAAQNIGIRKAVNDDDDFIFFADPDSEIPKDCVSKLVNKYNSLLNHNYSPGGVCTSALNMTTGLPVSLNGNLIQDIKDANVYEVSYMMNSGSLIPTKYFQEVGLMWENLFIDDVDCEWCWRATWKMKLHFFQDKDILIIHHLGNNARKVGTKYRSISPPLRLFYQYRNFLWLWRKGYAPRQWLLYNGWKYIIKAIYFPIFIEPRWLNFKNIVRGIFHGIHHMP